jgi:hypothetical protein
MLKKSNIKYLEIEEIHILSMNRGARSGSSAVNCQRAVTPSEDPDPMARQLSYTNSVCTAPSPS